MSTPSASWLPELLELRAQYPGEAAFTLSLRLETEKGVPGVTGRQVQEALAGLESDR